TITRCQTNFVQEILSTLLAVQPAHRAHLQRKREGAPIGTPPHTTGASVAAGSAHYPAALSAPRTRAGVIGDSRRRTPVASKNAFASATGTGESDGYAVPRRARQECRLAGAGRPRPGAGRIRHVGACQSVDVDPRSVLEANHRIRDPV